MVEFFNQQFFGREFTGGPFVLFSPSHLAALFAIVLMIFYVSRLRGVNNEQTRKIFRVTLAVVVIANELTWHIWNLVTGQWTLQTMLPLHLCSVFVFLCAYMLIKRTYAVYEFAYLLGIAGALQAILTPDLGIYDFPHFRYYQVFVSHGIIVVSAIYMTVVEGFRPYWHSLRRVFLWSNVYMLAVGLINALIGSNYLYIAHKPLTASLMDVLPPWPWYIGWIEVIGLASMLILYLPFAVRDFMHARNLNPA
jgi:hypothetical integral membrane protein (TIGR02206 family)